MKKKVLLLNTVYYAELALFSELKNSDRYEPFVVAENYPSVIGRYDENVLANVPRLVNAQVIGKMEKGASQRILDSVKPDIIILRCLTRYLHRLCLPNVIYWKIESIPLTNPKGSIRLTLPQVPCKAFLTENKEEVSVYKNAVDVPVGYFPRGVSRFWEKIVPKKIDIMATGTAVTSSKLSSYRMLVQPLCKEFSPEQLHIYQCYGQKNMLWAKDYIRPCHMAEDGPRVIGSAKILISPITGRYDKGILSHKTLQGMACRTLVITQKTPGIEDIIGENSEHVIYVDDPKEVVKVVKYYLAHDSEREKISERAYRFVHSEYNYTKVFERAMKQIGVF